MQNILTRWGTRILSRSAHPKAIQLLVRFSLWWNRHSVFIDLIHGSFLVSVSIWFWVFLAWPHTALRVAVVIITAMGGLVLLGRGLSDLSKKGNDV